MIHEYGNGGMSITRPHVELFRLASMLSGLGLETKGIKVSRRGSLYANIKREFGFKGNKQSVYEQFSAYYEARKAALLTVYPADGSNDKGQEVTANV